jgi:taspase (threonine aspartase 1)
VDHVVDIISHLEDDENFNAGYGSNLTLEGSVECDAAVMNEHGHFGSVGAVAGVKNPIRAAQQLLKYAQKDDYLGRVPPL